MRDVVAQSRPDLLALASDVVGEDPFARASDGTKFAQPAIFCASLAGWIALGRPGDVMAGHSLGELTALVAAGYISETDGLELVALRGRLMQEAGEHFVDGGMLALLGDGAADHAAEIADAHDLAVANDNCPTQVVLSGALPALAAAAQAATELGLRPMELPVSGAFHSPMMASAVPSFSAALDRVEMHERRVLVLTAVTAKPYDDVRRRLVEGLPGRVLTGLVKRTLADKELVHA